MLSIPFYKPSLGQAEIDAVIEVLQSGWLTTGAKTKQFEREFAERFNQQHAVAVNSCTAALHLALEAVGVQAGEGVVVPTMTFAATAEVVRYLGARPILADCRVDDFNLDVTSAEEQIQIALRHGITVSAIMPVHYGGQIGDVSGIRQLSQKYGLKIVEDAAHCCPAYFRRVITPQLTALSSNQPANGLGRAVGLGENPHRPYPSGESSRPDPAEWAPVGSSADISCFSFYANKCITTGEGGMACTNSDQYADRMRIMSLHGISRDAWKRYTGEGTWYYEILAPGYKYNLTDIASALGMNQLNRIERFHKDRSRLAALYHERLRHLEELILPEVRPDRIHSWHLYVIRLRSDQLSINRAQFIDALTKAGIGSSVHYMPLHMHPYYREQYGYQPADLPNMAKVFAEIVSLPLYPSLSEEQLDYICRVVEGLVRKHAVQRTSRVHSAAVSQPHVAVPAELLAGSST